MVYVRNVAGWRRGYRPVQPLRQRMAPWGGSTVRPRAMSYRGAAGSASGVRHAEDCIGHEQVALPANADRRQPRRAVERCVQRLARPGADRAQDRTACEVDLDELLVAAEQR